MWQIYKVKIANRNYLRPRKLLSSFKSAPVLALNDWGDLKRLRFDSESWLVDTYNELMPRGTDSVKADFWLQEVHEAMEAYQRSVRRLRVEG